MTRADLEFPRGDDWNGVIYVKDADANPVNISGSTFYFTIKSCLIGDTSDADALYKQTVISHLNAVSGISMVSLPNASGVNFSVGSYDYDIVWKTAAGQVNTLFIGKINMLQDVTLEN